MKPSSFIDKIDIEVCSGNGGAGAVSFRREAKVPRGGPDGGDGGKGGDVILVGDPRKRTLLDFKYKKTFQAQSGRRGAGSKMYGKKGDDIRLPVPLGTQIIEYKTGKLLLDVLENKDYLLIEGGKGGLGNFHFRNSRVQAPEYAQPGIEGECLEISLELKLIADIGVIGFPNAGKSTLLSTLSKAKPDVAPYPFTTINPQLGVLEHKGHQLVIADLPGLIEGASEGVGLGHKFLRHTERTGLLLHLVSLDPSEQDSPLERYRMIRKELENYSSQVEAIQGELLDKRNEIVVLSKLDLVGPDVGEHIVEEFRNIGVSTFCISAPTHYNIDRVKDMLIQLESES